MKHPIVRFRQEKGLTQAELAKRAGISKQQMGKLESGLRKMTRKWAEKLAPALGREISELMFPETASINIMRFNSVFEVLEDETVPEVEPKIAIGTSFLSRLLPKAAHHKFQLMTVESYHEEGVVNKGDAVLIDLDDNKAIRPGLYAIEIAGTIQWRYLSPTTTGMILVRADNASTPPETAKPDDLKIVGRARIRISTL